MSDYLEHGKFKYIDKWKSKTGKWVYKYAEDAKKKVQNLNDKYGPKYTQKSHTYSIKNDGRHPKGYDRVHSETRRNVIGGRAVSTQHKIYQRSSDIKAPSKAARFVSRMMSKAKKLNDIYGPKITTTTRLSSSNGKQYVDKVTRNLIGGRLTEITNYEKSVYGHYWEGKDVKPQYKYQVKFDYAKGHIPLRKRKNSFD